MPALRHVVVLAALLCGDPTLCPAAAPPFVHRDADGDPFPAGAVRRLGTLRLFHPGEVGFKAFTPDGRFLITAAYAPHESSSSGAERFRVWDLTTGRLSRQFGRAGSGIHHAVQSPDGRRIVSSGPAGTFLWDVTSGRLIRRLEKEQDPSHSNQIDRSAFRDEKTLVAVRYHRIATLNLADGRRVGEIRLPEETTYPIDCFFLSPDGRQIVTSGGDEGIEFVDTATGKVRGHIRAGEEWNVSFHPGGKVLAVEQASEGTIQIHDAKTLRLLRKWKLRKGYYRDPLNDGPSSVFVPGGNLLATPGAREAPDLWDWTTGTFVRKLGEGIGDLSGLTFSLDGKKVASGSDIDSNIGRIRVFAVATGKELLPFEGHRTSIGSIRYIDSNTLVSTSEWGDPALTWDVRTGRVVRSDLAAKFGDVLSPDGKVYAHPESDGTVLLTDSATGKKLRLLGVSRPPAKPGPNELPLPHSPWAVVFSPDGSVLAYADPNGPIRLWRVDTGKECGRLGKWDNSKVARCLTFSPDGKRLAAGGYSGGGIVEVWDTVEGKLLRQMTAPVRGFKYRADLIGLLGGVEAVVFTPDGRAVAVKNSEGPVRLWDIGSGRQLLRSDPELGKDASCTAVACSPDGQLVASAEWGNSIVSWDIATGREVGRFSPTGGRDVQALAFSPDGRMLASGGDDPTILLWKIPASARKAGR